MSLALEFEAKTVLVRGSKVPNWSSSPKPNASGTFTRAPDNRDPPFSHSAAQTNSRAPFTSNQLQSRPWDAERQAQLAKGLCFNCNEKFGPGQWCKSSLCLLEITEDDSLEHEEADGDPNNDAAAVDIAEISFHAILGNSIVATLKLQGEINMRQVSFLLTVGQHIILLLKP